MTAPGKNRKRSQKADHDRDLLHHSLDGLDHIGNVDHRHRGIGVKERPLHRAHLPRIHMRRAVPDHRQPGQRPRREDEFTARVHVLAVVADDRRDLGLNRSSIRGEHDIGNRDASAAAAQYARVTASDCPSSLSHHVPCAIVDPAGSPADQVRDTVCSRRLG